MKNNILTIFHLSTLIISVPVSMAYAINCPEVPEYTLQGHNEYHTRCAYESKVIIGRTDIQEKTREDRCPIFALEDPHFRVAICRFDSSVSKCICSVVRK